MIKSYRVGPGQLRLGDGGAQDASAQLTNCRVEWAEQVNTPDPINVLSGEQLTDSEEATYTATLVGNVLQDIDAAGLVSYTWTNRGNEVPFVFVPNDVEARQVTGTVVLVPLTLGGDAKARPQSDFTWRIVGEPILGALV